MFAGVAEAVARALEPLREQLPTIMDYGRRYIEAKEREADAVKTIADAVTVIATEIIRD